MRWLLTLTLIAIPQYAWASGFVAEKGTWWNKVDYSSWNADSKFAGLFERDPSRGVHLGDRVSFDSSTGGELRTQSVAWTTAFSPVERLSIGFHLPFFQQVRFEDTTFLSTTVGVGDPRPSIAFQVTPIGAKVGTVLAIDGKIPVSTLPAGFDTIPLGEGQGDIALRHETSWSPSHQLMFTVMTVFRHRMVFVDGDRRIKPGDEAEVGLSVAGSPLSNLWLSAGLYGLWSTGSEDRSSSGAVTLRDRRQVQEATAGLYLSFGRWIAGPLRGLALDASARVPLHGQDYPVGPTWSAGLAYEVDLY